MNELAIGELLAKKRKEQKLKVKKAALELKIKQEYIEAIEEGRLSYMSQHIYPTGYIKSYAKWLGMTHEEVAMLIKSNGKPVDANVEELEPYQKKPITKAGSAITGTGKVGFGSLFAFLTPTRFSSQRQKTPDLKVLPISSKTLLLAVIFAAITYGGWRYLDHNSPELLPDTLFTSIDKATQPEGYYADGSQKLVMFASEETVIHLFYPVTETKMQRLLSVGEAYFLPEETEVIVNADNAEAVDVFAGPDGSELLGTLNELSKRAKE